MSFKAQIKMMGQPSFKDSSMKRFASEDEARHHGSEYYSKAIMAVAYQVVEVDDPVTHTFLWRKRVYEEVT